MKKLTEIGCKNNTDKANHHQFTEIYDDFFSLYKSPRILEIGVYNFCSIQTYLDYFDNPYIVGMDIDNKDTFLNDKWKFIQGDQSNISDLNKCVENEEKFDIILDDGGHTMKQQQISFGFLINHVKSGGYYILEDLHTSFIKQFIETDDQFTSYEMLSLMNKKITPFSNYISIDEQISILSKIESVNIYTNNNNPFGSITSVIKVA